MKIKVDVSSWHIEKGLPSEGDRCPVALALSDALALNDRKLDVGHNSFTISYADGTYLMNLPLPGEAQNFIYRFDNHNPVEPFSFEIDYYIDPFIQTKYTQDTTNKTKL